MLSSLPDLVLVILGFGLIVLVHELGHFLAARWAGVRVLAFAVGFGPPVATFRKGLGLRRGSTEPVYLAALKRGEARGLSPTEYRLNALPFGGYVKMLGQSDIESAAKGDEPDSYQNVSVFKRMVIISAGVVMNIILAALLFILVMMVGRTVEPPKLGRIDPTGAAAHATCDTPGVSDGLRTGDTVLRIGEREPRTFDDLLLASAMARKDADIPIIVRRDGVNGAITFRARPRKDAGTGLLGLGVEPARSTSVIVGKSKEENDALRKQLAAIGFGSVEPGMRLTHVNGSPATDITALTRAIETSQGKDVDVTFASDDNPGAHVTIPTVPSLANSLVASTSDKATASSVTHVLGLAGVLKVEQTSPQSEGVGLRAGDVFARLGNTEYPSTAEGIREIRSHAGRRIRVVVHRLIDGVWKDHDLGEVAVNSKGQIGFLAADTLHDNTFMAKPVARVLESTQSTDEVSTPASGLAITPGSTLLRIGDEPVATLGAARDAIVRFAASAEPINAARPDASIAVPITIRRAGANSPEETLVWKIDQEVIRAAGAMGYTSLFPIEAFELEHVALRAKNPIEALKMGLAETHRVMLTTYLTFARLAEGTIRVEHLKGPVGIAHLGTLVAGRGTIWLLFFLALISVNLAVINFLPLPIVDGGQFLMLLYEAIRGKPVPIAIQNGVTMLGLLLIGSIFLFVTYNDIRNLFGM